MKIKFLCSCFLFVVAFYSSASGQTHKQVKPAAATVYPSSFKISRQDFDHLFLYHVKDVVKSKANKHLDKAVLMTKSETGDMKFMKFRLSYFKGADLMIQVNGSYSIQVFIFSDNSAVFYKGRFEKNDLIMEKCRKDDIISE